MTTTILKIVSGGQTGADRAALDFAIAHGIPNGGWCPRGRLAEDGIIAARYQLIETPSDDTAQRTEWNVRDSDATVIFSVAAELTGGSQLTAQLANRLNKLCLHLSRDRDGVRAPEKLATFLSRHRVEILNIAGPRASNEPEAAAFTRAILEQTILGASTRPPASSGCGK